MDWALHHVGHLLASGGTLGTALMFMFKDSIREWWQEYHAERRLIREQKLAVHTRGDRAMSDLISLLRDDLKAQRDSTVSMKELLERMVIANERCVDVQRVMSNQLSDVDKRLYRIEGAMGRAIQ